MKKLFDSVMRVLMPVLGLVELYMAAKMSMPGALVPLAIGSGILAWQGLRLRRYLRERRSGSS
jgi:hypothetical protein